MTRFQILELCFLIKSFIDWFPSMFLTGKLNKSELILRPSSISNIGGFFFISILSLSFSNMTRKFNKSKLILRPTPAQFGAVFPCLVVTGALCRVGYKHFKRNSFFNNVWSSKQFHQICKNNRTSELVLKINSPFFSFDGITAKIRK